MKKRTPSSFADDPDEPAPLGGEYYWKKTNQVRPPSPTIGRSGHVDKETVHVLRGDEYYVRRYASPVQPNSPYQVSAKKRLTLAQKNWSTLPAKDRDAWHAYALEKAFNDRPHKQDGNAGQNAYAHAQANRLGWGADSMSVEAPTLPPPPAPLSIEQVPAPEPNEFAFRIRHTVANWEGCRVLFEMTPATPTLRRTPHIRDFRWSGTHLPDSFLPLGPDGAIHVLDATRFQVSPGQRYGMRISLLTPDGMAGPKLTGDFIRM